MNSFIKSTQYKNWIKTKEGLEKIEKNKVQKIRKTINEINLLIKKENDEKSKHLNYNQKNELKRYISEKDLLILEKEKILIVNYSNKLIKILNSQKRKSTSLKNNSISYFRRFFLKKSILDYDPKYLMAASFFLGAKVAEKNYPLEELYKRFPIVKGAEKILFEYEFYLVSVLDYEFYVYNPYQALLGFIFTLEQKEFFFSSKLPKLYKSK